MSHPKITGTTMVKLLNAESSAQNCPPARSGLGQAPGLKEHLVMATPESTFVAERVGVGNAIIELNGMYVTGRLTDDLGANAHYIHAPMIVTDAAVRDGLLRDPHIRETFVSPGTTNVPCVVRACCQTI